MNDTMSIEYIGNGANARIEMNRGTFRYQGVRLLRGGVFVAEFHEDPLSDYRTCAAVAQCFGQSGLTHEPNFTKFIYYHGIISEVENTPEWGRSLSDIEKVYYDHLYALYRMNPDNIRIAGAGSLRRLRPESVRKGDAPAFSVYTRRTSGGAMSARAALYLLGVTPPLYVGDGVSLHYGTDRTSATVMEVSPSGKTITVAEDTWWVTSGDESQEGCEYDFATNPEGSKTKIRLRKDGKYYPVQHSQAIALGRSRYIDPHF